MAIIVPTPDDGNNREVAAWTWSAITVADTGAKAQVGNLVNAVVHIVGAGNAQMRGSNDGVNFVNIGAALAANSLNLLTFLPRFIDFNPIAAATVTIVLVGRRPF